MNLKFLDDIYYTIDTMKNAFYYLGILVGIHTTAFLVYLTHRSLSKDNLDDVHNDNSNAVNNDGADVANSDDSSDGEDVVNNDDSSTLKSENENSDDVDAANTTDNPSIVEDISNLSSKKEEYKYLLQQKSDELNNLVVQLDTVYNNIGRIREHLETLNHRTT